MTKGRNWFPEENEDKIGIEKWLAPKAKRLLSNKGMMFNGIGFLKWKKNIAELLEMVKLSGLLTTHRWTLLKRCQAVGGG